MMQAGEPTTLHVPGAHSAPLPASPGATGLAWAAVVVPVLVFVGWVIVRRVRMARLSPEERAFRSLARRLRLPTGQVERVRAYAGRQAGCSPIQVLMDEGLLAQATGGGGQVEAA